LFYLCFVGNSFKSSKRREKERRRDKVKKNSKSRQKGMTGSRATMLEKWHGGTLSHGTVVLPGPSF